MLGVGISAQKLEAREAGQKTSATFPSWQGDNSKGKYHEPSNYRKLAGANIPPNQK